MDLVEYSHERFAEIVADFAPFLEKLGVADWLNIPISALRGDNVVDPSGHMPWYRGPTLLHHLEEVEVDVYKRQGPASATTSCSTPLPTSAPMSATSCATRSAS